MQPNESDDFGVRGVPAAPLLKLQAQLRALIPAVTIGGNREDITGLLAELKETAAQVEVLPTVSQPEILDAIGAALRHAAAARWADVRTELLDAYRGLSELMLSNRRCPHGVAAQ
jgi:hypothetical protein